MTTVPVLEVDVPVRREIDPVALFIVAAAVAMIISPLGAEDDAPPLRSSTEPPVAPELDPACNRSEPLESYFPVPAAFPV